MICNVFHIFKANLLGGGGQVQSELSLFLKGKYNLTLLIECNINYAFNGLAFHFISI